MWREESGGIPIKKTWRKKKVPLRKYQPSVLMYCVVVRGGVGFTLTGFCSSWPVLDAGRTLKGHKK